MVPDVEEHEGVALADQVVDRPTQRLLAARREVHRHADLPLRHAAALPLRSNRGVRFLSLRLAIALASIDLP